MPFGHYHDVQKPTTPVKVLLIAESRPEEWKLFLQAGSQHQQFLLSWGDAGLWI